MHLAIVDAIVAAVEAGDDAAQSWFVDVVGQQREGRKGDR